MNCTCGGKRQYPSQPHCNCVMQDMSTYSGTDATLIRTRRKRARMSSLMGKRKSLDGTR